MCLAKKKSHKAWGAFSHGARTAPVITVFTPVTALKTCHLYACMSKKMMPRSRHPENVSPYTGLRVPVCKGTYTQEGGGLMLQGHTMAIVPCGNPTPKKMPTGGGEWPTFRTARAQRTHSARYAPLVWRTANNLQWGTVAPAPTKQRLPQDLQHRSAPRCEKDLHRLRKDLEIASLQDILHGTYRQTHNRQP